MENKMPILNSILFYASAILIIVINPIMLYYLIKLEDIDCKCIRDWRHTFIKYITLLTIIFYILLQFDNDINIVNILKRYVNIGTLNDILFMVNLYAFYTYIGDLNDTKCICAVEKQKNLNNFLNIMRYIIVIPISLILIGIYIFYL